MNDQTAFATDDSMPVGAERYRPRHHFTPRRNWMNDPNGLVFFDGEYHLFYQYNPHGMDWGHMSWGHAVSPDLVHWEELPVAIPETDRMIFSGCCVIDRDNVTGLGDGSRPPMLAFFTAYDEAAQRQTQHLAYSLDRGRSFTHYAHNPIIDLDLEHFRDPKVFWHAETARWIMAVALPREHKVQFYRSTDLLRWEYMSAFGPAGATGGQWECPDIFPVPVEGHRHESHWVLKVDVDDNFVDGGSGAQYFVGHFDGVGFTIDADRGSPEGDPVDYGPDFYAAVSWSDLPPEQSGPVWIGWMSNHQTGRHYPTYPWRGAQSLPRTLYLFEQDGRLKLGQRPVGTAPMASAVRDPVALSVAAGETAVLGNPNSAFTQRLSMSCTALARCSIALASGTDTLMTIDVDWSSRDIVFHRHAGADGVNGFARSTKAVVQAEDQIRFDLIFDGCTLEVFVNDGALVYSACLFPAGPVSTIVACSRGTLALVFRQER